MATGFLSFFCVLVAASATATWPIVPSDIFVAGQGYLLFRIPALVRLPSGGIAAFAEGRNTATDVGYNDIVYV